jgi:ATP-dependent protease HslVU (ClpYQ) peptidase subunit
MTVVSAVVDGNVCVFSSDSGSFSEDSVSIRPGSKILHKSIAGAGECLIGFAGTFAICQWIKFLHFPECPSEVSNFEQYLVQYLQPFLFTSLRKRWKKSSDGHEPQVEVGDFILLLGMHGCLYTLYSNGDVEKAQAHPGKLCFASIGTGGELSNAGMYAIQSVVKDLSSWEILEAGMKNAETFSLHVRGPFEVKYSFQV